MPEGAHVDDQTNLARAPAGQYARPDPDRWAGSMEPQSFGQDAPAGRPGSRNRRGFRWQFLLAFLALALCVAIAVPLILDVERGGSSDVAVGQCTPNDKREQCVLQTKHMQDQAALEVGSAEYPALIAADVDRETILTVRVAPGVETTVGPTRLDTAADGFTSQAVHIGGNVAVSAQSTVESITIVALDPAVQPVFGVGEEGLWRFRIKSTEPGEFEIILSFAVLHGDGTNIPLRDPFGFVTYHVHQTGSNVIGDVGDWLVKAGAVVGAIAAVVGAVVAVAKRARIREWWDRGMTRRPPQPAKRKSNESNAHQGDS